MNDKRDIIEIVEYRDEDKCVYVDIEYFVSEWKQFNVVSDWKHNYHWLRFEVREDPMVSTLRNAIDNTVEVKFEGSFCWRGCWESRIYSSSDELWGQEFLDLAELLRDVIVPYCKKHFMEHPYYKESLEQMKEDKEW